MEKEQNSSEKKSDKALREWLQIAVITAATLIGAYEFVYKDIYKPSMRPTSLTVEADMVAISQTGGRILVEATIRTNNPTDRRVYVPAFWVTARGVRLTKSNENFREDHSSLLGPELGGAIISTYYPVEAVDVVAQKRITWEDQSWWEPKDQTKDELIFSVPSGIYDYLVMNVTHFHTRYIDDINPPEWTALEDGSWDVTFSLKGKESDPQRLIEWQKSTASGYNWNVTTLPLPR